MEEEVWDQRQITEKTVLDDSALPNKTGGKTNHWGGKKKVVSQILHTLETPFFNSTALVSMIFIFD